MSTELFIACESDLEKFIKVLVVKYNQVVVQSRFGEKIETISDPLGGNDWFNLSIDDHPEVCAETKKVMWWPPGKPPINSLPLCVEISLKTNDGDEMILEFWTVDLFDSEDPCEKTANSIYTRMGTVLKSVISLSRSFPSYRICRNRSPDSYKIFYSIYVERPKIRHLGENFKTVCLGQVNTIMGKLVMTIYYRTKMTITHKTIKGLLGTKTTNSIMMDSNYFEHTNDDNKIHRKKPAVKKVERIVDIEKPLKLGAFTDVSKLRKFTEDDFILPETPPFEWLLKKPRHESGSSVESLNRKCDSPQTSPLGNGHQNNININNGLNNNLSNSNNNTLINSGSFKNLENDTNLQRQEFHQQKPSHNFVPSQLLIKNILVPQSSNNATSQPLDSISNLTQTSTSNRYSADDEYLLKELNFPFASSNTPLNDVGKFFKDCFNPPPLISFAEPQTKICANTNTTTIKPNSTSGSSNTGKTKNSSTVDNAQICSSTAANDSDDYLCVDDLTRQLEEFETTLEEYDELASQLEISQTSSWIGTRPPGGL